MKIAALAVLLAAAPAAAQVVAPTVDFENALRQAQLDAMKAALRAKAVATVETTLVAMRDGVGAGMTVADYLEAQGIKVEVAQQTEAVKTSVSGGKKVITLSDALPPFPRVYGPLIAEQAAKLMYADMPACAERSYMVRGTAGRVWVELGGAPQDLPVIEGTNGLPVPAVSEAMGAWATDAAQMALYKIGQAENLPELPEMSAQDDAGRAKLDAANKRFVAFLLDEAETRRTAGLR